MMRRTAPLTRRRRQDIVALVFVALVIAVSAWGGVGVIWGMVDVVIVIILVFGLGHMVYAAVVQRGAARRRVALEADRLVQRDSDDRVVATIDLTAPFAAKCEEQDADWVLYKVSQGRTTMWMSIPSNADGALVRAVGPTWPPREPSGARYIP
jgi:hypothetical protein